MKDKPIKDKPILFSGPMVRALLEGRKTQTRRVIKPQPVVLCGKDGHAFMTHNPTHYEDGSTSWTMVHRVIPNGENIYTKFPFQVGDRLWVRETFSPCACYKCNDPAMTPFHKPAYRSDIDRDIVWKPSIFMPRWASRITLRVTGVKVEQVQEITEEDCVAEGMYRENTSMGLRYCYGQLWNQLNEKRGYGWDKNPWVWCYTFEVAT